MTAPTMRSLTEIIADGMQRWPDINILTFVSIGSDAELCEESRSYADLQRNGLSIADGLVRAGMRSGDAFAIVAPNHPEFVEAMIGSSFAGTVFVPIDARTAGDKLRYMLDFADCRGAIVASYALAEILAVKNQLPKLEWIWVIGELKESELQDGVSALQEILSAGPSTNLQPTHPDLASPMQLLFTSGTTGDPKAILSPHARFAGISSLGAVLGFLPNDRPYTGLSLTHANAQLITLGNSLAMGLPLVISRTFTKSRLWEILHQYQCTTFNLLGGMATAIFAEPAGPFDRDHDVRFVLSAGMPTALWQPFSERYGVDIFEFYGAAEGGLTINAPGTGPSGSIGKAPPSTLCAILDDDDNICPPGELGELCFRNADGSVPPVEYYRNPSASIAKIRNGWFRSGDIGFKDEAGWVYFSHRDGASIRRNGEFISSGDVEAKIASIEGVADVHVYGAMTTSNAPGECEIVAAIVPTDATDFNPAELFVECRKLLPRNAVPSYIQLLDSIPKTASEKPQAHFLSAMLTEGQSKLFGINGSTTIEIKERVK